MQSIFVDIWVFLRVRTRSGREGEKGEVDRDAVVMGAEQEGLKVAQKALVRLLLLRAL